MPVKATRVSQSLTEAPVRPSDRSGTQPSGRSTGLPDDADDVVIIGAGPAGLTAAYVLAGKGKTSTVLEADDTVGGISRTVERDGWRFDVGGHRFFTKVKAVEDLWHEILPGEELMLRPRMSRIYYQGKYYEYPLKPLNALRNLGLLESLRCAASYAWARVHPPEDQSTFEGWVAARFGWRLYQHFFKTYTEKVWGYPGSELQADWAAQRIKNLNLLNAVTSALFPKKGQREITTLIDQFEYPRLGPGMMWEQCCEKVEAAGSKVLMKASGNPHPVRGRKSRRQSSPLPTAPRPSTDVPPSFRLCRCRPWSGPSTRPRRTRYWPPQTTCITGTTSRSPSSSPKRPASPTTGCTSTTPPSRWDGSRTLAVGPRTWSRTGPPAWAWNILCSKGTRCGRWRTMIWSNSARLSSGRLGLVDPSAIKAGYVVRMPKAYPYYDADYARNVETLRKWLEVNVANVYPVGRNGMHRYNNQDHSMYTAMLTVENIMGASHDVWSVNVEEEYHEQMTPGEV